MFNIEDEYITEEDDIPKTNVTTRSQNSLKEDNLILPKIKKLWENMRKVKNNTPTITYLNLSFQARVPRKLICP